MCPCQSCQQPSPKWGGTCITPNEVNLTSLCSSGMLNSRVHEDIVMCLILDSGVLVLVPSVHFLLLCLSFPSWHLLGQVCNQNLLCNWNEKQEIWGQSLVSHVATLNWISLTKVPFFLNGENLQIHGCCRAPIPILLVAPSIAQRWNRVGPTYLIKCL